MSGNDDTQKHSKSGKITKRLGTKEQQQQYHQKHIIPSIDNL